MLVLTRGEGEEVIIRDRDHNHSYVGTIVVVGSDRVRLGFSFSPRFIIMRKEIDPGDQPERRAADGDGTG